MTAYHVPGFRRAVFFLEDVGLQIVGPPFAIACHGEL